MLYIGLILMYTLFLYKNSYGSMCNFGESYCSVTFLDRKDLVPVGCDETTMLTTTIGSKLACARACMFMKACAVFEYSSQTNKCSLCPGDLIQNLTYSSEKVFSWPFKYFLESNQPYVQTTLNSRKIFVSDGLTVGSLVRLIYSFETTRGGLQIQFCQNSTATTSVNCSLISSFSFYNISTWARLNSTYEPSTTSSPRNSTFDKNAKVNLDILVSTDGYLMYMNQDYQRIAKHVMPTTITRYISINLRAPIHEINV
ncbi:hypothetical protein Bpfe_016047 [Biomphalaria pfeifferi]|uniref:Apple domain-containing protein n=1 Tax=Biomphalaria pfeifferi TaxID=112525 RepID=A0AAD8F8P0_BIOPF|nr:hypothetical protein Bpfe_016047 [Biomphalaria pfeifferi]